MLDLMRKHASSWLIKLALTLIILTFIFFFGYSRIASKFQDGQRYIAVVGTTGIPRRKFEASYEGAAERMREQMGSKAGELPEGFLNYLKNNILEQLVSRELTAQYGEQIGFQVSDEEIAESVQKNKNLFTDGRFDLDVYQQRFLPYFRQRYGEEFEAVVARDLLVGKVEGFLPSLFEPWHKELSASLDDIVKAKTAKKKPAPETAPAAPSVSSASTDEIFADWLEDFREHQKVVVFQQP